MEMCYRADSRGSYWYYTVDATVTTACVDDFPNATFRHFAVYYLTEIASLAMTFQTCSSG